MRFVAIRALVALACCCIVGVVSAQSNSGDDVRESVVGSHPGPIGPSLEAIAVHSLSTASAMAPSSHSSSYHSSSSAGASSVSSAAGSSTASRSASSSNSQSFITGTHDVNPSEPTSVIAAIQSQQARLQGLAAVTAKKVAAVNAKVHLVQQLENDLATADNQLLRKQKILAAQQFVNAHHTVGLQKEQTRLTKLQQQLVEDQQKVLQIQQILNLLGNPAFKLLAPPANVGVVVNHNVVSKLELHETPVNDHLSPGLYSLRGKIVADAIIDGPHMLVSLNDDGTIVGIAEYAKQNSHGLRVNNKAQVVGLYHDLVLEWTEIHEGHAFTFTGTFLAGSATVAGTFQVMGGDMGTFEYQLYRVHIMNPKKTHALPSDYLKALPDVNQPHQEGSFKGAFQPGFYVARGKAVNSLTGKETTTPDLLLNLRDDGSLVGRTAFLSNASNGETVVRAGGVWNGEGFMYSFLYGGKTFLFTGFLVPNTDDILGGDYMFGKSGRGHGRFAFHVKRAVFPEQPSLDHSSSSLGSSWSSSTSTHTSHSGTTSHSAPAPSSHSGSGSFSGGVSGSGSSSDDDESDSLTSNAGVSAHGASFLEFSPSITSTRPGNVHDSISSFILH